MLALVAVFLVFVMMISRRTRGPLWALAIAWLICIAPLVTGLLSYSYLPYSDVRFAVELLGFLLCFVVGVLVYDLVPISKHRSSAPPTRRSIDQQFTGTLPIARACWWVGFTGAALYCIDFYFMAGAGLSDMAALRDAWVGMEAASVYVRLGSVLTWACLYCFAFALTFRDRMTIGQSLTYMAPIGGYFLIAVFSAGRQAAFQIIIVTVLTLLLKRVRDSRFAVPEPKRKRSMGQAVFVVSISLFMVAYMGWVAVARNDATISDDKEEVLIRLFDVQVLPQFDAFLLHLGTGIRTTIVEGMIYFSSSVSLFYKFLGLSWPQHYFGAMSLPFVYRQLQAITGISPMDAYHDKVALLNGEGVIGVGWTSGISSYILDFGTAGACVLLLIQGFYSAYVWRRAISGYGFNDGMIAIVMLCLIVHMPLWAASSDTNFFLLFVFCLFLNIATAWRRSRRGNRQHRSGVGLSRDKATPGLP